MAQRVLPGAYVSLNDLSQIPEGATALTVGYTVKANRGPIDELKMVTSPADFLAKFTFDGKPAIDEDPTFWSILKVLARTNVMYVSRAANHPLYGGIVLKKATPAIGKLLRTEEVKDESGKVVATVLHVKTEGPEAIQATSEIMVNGASYEESSAQEQDINGYYLVIEDSSTETIIPSKALISQTVGTSLTDLTVNKETFENEIPDSSVDATYKFTYSGSNWILPTVVPSEATISQTTGTSLSDLQVDKDTLENIIDTSVDGTFAFTYDTDHWELESDEVDLTNYGITYEGTPVNADVITVTYTAELTEDVQVDLENYGITYTGTPVTSDEITVSYTAKKSEQSTNLPIKVKGKLPDTFTASSTSKAKVYKKPSEGITGIEINDINTITCTKASEETGKSNSIKLTIYNQAGALLKEEDEIIIKGTEVEKFNNVTYKIENITGDSDCEVVLSPLGSFEYEDITSEGGTIYASGISEPENLKNYTTGATSMIITGIDPGAYNGDFAFDITSSVDDLDMVYRKGAMVGGKECTFDTMILNVINSNTGDVLETFMFSLDPEAKDIAGSTLYVDDVVSGSAYIKIYHGENTDLPRSTVAGLPVTSDGGSNGGEVGYNEYIRALEPFKDKVVSVSILGNGCSPSVETKKFQQALMGIADERKDCFVFLNNPVDAERKTLNSDKAQAIVDYKKGDLANTSFYGCMYAPHVNTSDIYNGRDVKIGSEAVAIAGWLGIIDTLSYPYAYAGPRNGLVQGVTCDWKIGDMSGEAQVLNDASINYVAYDGKVGRYYMQCQNTLQVANSAMRNIGTVLNVLDIKEHFTVSLKEYLQLPITDALRRDIVNTANDYLSPMQGVRFYNYLFQDVSTNFDIADNTLRYLLTLSPTMYAQKIYLVMNIVNATFDFSILQSL